MSNKFAILKWNEIGRRTCKLKFNPNTNMIRWTHVPHSTCYKQKLSHTVLPSDRINSSDLLLQIKVLYVVTKSMQCLLLLPISAVSYPCKNGFSMNVSYPYYIRKDKRWDPSTSLWDPICFKITIIFMVDIWGMEGLVTYLGLRHFDHFWRAVLFSFILILGGGRLYAIFEQMLGIKIMWMGRTALCN